MNKENDINFLFTQMQELDKEIFPNKNNSAWFTKVATEEMQELANHTDRLNEVEEVGDLLFVVASYCRVNQINIAHAMSLSISKMRDRLKNKHYEKSVARNQEKVATDI